MMPRESDVLAAMGRAVGAWTPAEEAEFVRRHPVPKQTAVELDDIGGVRVYTDRRDKAAPMWWWWDCNSWVYYPQGVGGTGYSGGRGGHSGEPPPALRTAAYAVARAAGLVPKRVVE